MLPILFTIGSIKIFSLSVTLVIAWLVWSFLFWRKMKDLAVEEEKVFDCMFYATVFSVVLSRLFYILVFPQEFTQTWLKIVAIWVAPGMSLYGAIFGGVLSIVFIASRFKIRIGYIFDALASSLPYALMIGTIGSLLDGTVIGKPASLPFAVSYVGYSSPRHPVQIYQFIGLFVIGIILYVISKKSTQEKWRYGLGGVWFFFLWSLLFFVLEFFRDSNIYWAHLTPSQWALIIIFCESVGAIYIKSSIKYSVSRAFSHVFTAWNTRIKKIYESSQRRFRKQHTDQT